MQKQIDEASTQNTMKAFHHHLLIAMALLLGGSLAAQHSGTNFTLNQPITGGQHSYTATEFVRLAPGFRYQPLTGTDYFMAKIGESLVVEPPAEGTTGGPGGAGGIVGNDGIVGGTKGVFGVSETGQATYSFPLEFPGGISGMTPDLSLNYNSNGGDGIFGPGWALSGLSVIHVVAADRHHDGVINAAYGGDYGETTYTLDGGRLIRTDNTTGNTDLTFRKEQDDFSLIKRFQIPSGGGAKDNDNYYFIVKTKSGLTYEYGRNEDSRFRYETFNHVWYSLSFYVNQISDNFGNLINFYYENNVETGEIYINQITYTTSLANANSIQDPQYSITFLYEDRIVPYVAYYQLETGSTGNKTVRTQTNKQVSEISCYYHPAMENKLVKKYKLGYIERGQGSSLTKIKYLSSIQEFGLEESQNYNKTVFEWEDYLTENRDEKNSLFIEEPSRVSQDGEISNISMSFADLNNDGDLEILRTYIEKYTFGGWPSQTHYIWNHCEVLSLVGNQYLTTKSLLYGGEDKGQGLIYHFGDFNGDGFLDYIHQTLSSADQPNIFTYHDLYGNGMDGSFYYYYAPYYGVVADYNGDGISDLGLLHPDTEKIIFRLGDPENPLQSNIDNDVLTYGEQGIAGLFERVIDIGGDGRPELLTDNSGTKNIYYLQPKEDNSNISVTSIEAEDYGDGTLCNLNPDGKVDKVKTISTATDTDGDGWVDQLSLTLKYWYGTGAGFVLHGEDTFPVPYDIHTPSQYPPNCQVHEIQQDVSCTPFISVDLNADGISDFILKTTTVFSFFDGNYSICGTEEIVEFSSFIISGVGAIQFSNSDATLKSLSKVSILSGDYNGDSKIDLLFYNQDGIPPSNFDLMSLPAVSNRISKIINPVGAITEIDYSLSSDKEVYTQSNVNVEFPIVPLSANQVLVKAVKRGNGFGGVFEEEYSYKNAIAHTEGLGYLGFEKIIRKDVTKGIAYEKTYEIIDDSDKAHYPNYPKTEKTSLIGGPVLWETNYEHKTNSTTAFYGGKYYFVQPVTSTTTLYELNEAGTSSYAYKKETVSYSPFSIFGDPETITETSESIGGSNPSIITKTTVNQYKAADTEKWILGRLENASTTFTSSNNTAITKKVGFTYYDAPSENNYGMLRQEITEPDDAALKTTKEYIYDEYGNITTTILSAQGLTSRENKTEYEPSGRFIEYLVNAKAHKTKRSYEAVLGTLTHQEDTDNELVTSFTYNAFGQLEKTIAPDNTQFVSVARWVLQDDNQAPLNAVYYIWSRSSGQSPKKVYYNCLGQELRTVTTGFDGNAVYTDTQYDAKGRVWKKSEPYLPGGTVYYSSIEYDAVGRIKTTTAPDHGGNAVTSFKYLGLTTTITNPKGHTTSTIVNAAGWVVQTNDELGGIVTNHYYSDGGKAWSQVNNDARTKKSYLYDKAGRLKEYHDLSQAPNKIYYTYNAYGEPATEINNAGQLTSYDMYDELGRLKQKTTPDGTVTYGYDAQKKGLPDYMQAGNSHKIEYTYDQYARPIKTIETIEGQIFETGQSYDALGRAAVLTYPSGYAVRHHYNSNGFPEKITEEGSNKQLWKAGAMNARNQYTVLNYGSYISQSMTYYEQDGKLKQQSVANKQLNDYNWDKLGNLTYRKTRLGKTEGFSYDAMNRIRYVYHNGQLNFTYNYDALGNLTFKTGVGNYSYEDIADPYKLTAIDNKPATIHNERQEISYNWFNKVKTITERDPQSMAVVRQMELWYGVGMQRVKQVMQNTGQPSETTWYVGGMYEKTEKNGQTTLTHYVAAPSGLVAVVKQTGNNRVINYVLTDHQGSVQLVLSEAGVILEENSYDVWGLRRDPITYDVYAVMPATQLTHGYTGHEHLDLFMLVNMNGRVYDPVLGRFLSPDPVLQFPNYTQGHNPYAYVLNNPLRYTDPSGYTLVGQLVATSLCMFASAIPGVNLFVPILIYSVAMTIDHAIELGRNAKGGELMGYFIQTFALTAINMGVTQMIGDYFKIAQIKNAKEFKRAMVHGIFNGGMRMAQGGKFEHGFASGFVSSLGGSFMLENAPNMSKGAQVALAAVIGGTAEALGGGKFANGAVTGAYVMMLNHMAHQGDGGDEKNRTGRKFYDEKGNPLSDENIKGKDTQIIVIPEEAINEFNKALAFAKRFGNFTEFNQIVAKYGVEYHYIIAGDQLYVNEKLSTFETIKMFAHFAGEGFAASMMASKFTNDRITNRPNPGLEQHYQSVFTARDLWLPRSQLINFKPWW